MSTQPWCQRGFRALSATICLSKALQTRLSCPALAPPTFLPVPVSTSARCSANCQRQTQLSQWQSKLPILTGFLLSFIQYIAALLHLVGCLSLYCFFCCLIYLYCSLHFFSFPLYFLYLLAFNIFHLNT